MAFSSQNKNRNLTAWRQQNQTRPGTTLVIAPCDHLVVVNNSVFNFVFQNCIAYLFRTFLINEFCRVTANKNDRAFLVEFLLKILQIGQHMQTVDAAVCPKVN